MTLIVRAFALATIFLAAASGSAFAKSCAEVFALWDDLQSNGTVVELLDRSIPSTIGQHPTKTGGGFDGVVQCDALGELVGIIIVPNQESRSDEPSKSLVNLINTTRSLWIIISDTGFEFQVKDDFFERLSHVDEQRKGGAPFPFSSTVIRSETNNFSMTISYGFNNEKWAGWYVIIR